LSLMLIGPSYQNHGRRDVAQFFFEGAVKRRCRGN
jgi:hypothetical protein